MKRETLAAALCAVVVATGPLAAGAPAPQPADERNQATTVPDPQSRVITGMVTDYKPGKWLAVRTERNGNETFQLDESNMKASIDARVAVGSRVKVTERVEGDARTLTVTPA